MKKADSVPVHSVGKAMELLEILLQHRVPLSLSELSELSGYPKPTVHAILTTMREYSVITQQTNGKYDLGVRLFECGCAVSNRWEISAAAHPYLERLAADVGASSYISIMEENYVVNFDQCIGHSGIRVIPDIGYRLPLHATSQGKLFLSQFSDSDVKSRISTAGQIAYTPHTITDPVRLLDELHQIAQNGYAVEDGEYKIGLRSVSAPVLNREGKMSYAVGVIGLFRRVHSEEFENAAARVRETAVQLSNAIGFQKI